MLPLNTTQTSDAEASATLQPLEASAAAGSTAPEVDRLGRRLAAGRAGQIRFLRGRLPSLEDAQDVLQDTLLAMARSLREFRGASSVSTWLYSGFTRMPGEGFPGWAKVSSRKRSHWEKLLKVMWPARDRICPISSGA